MNLFERKILYPGFPDNCYQQPNDSQTGTTINKFLAKLTQGRVTLNSVHHPETKKILYNRFSLNRPRKNLP